MSQFELPFAQQLSKHLRDLYMRDFEVVKITDTDREIYTIFIKAYKGKKSAQVGEYILFNQGVGENERTRIYKGKVRKHVKTHSIAKKNAFLIFTKVPGTVPTLWDRVDFNSDIPFP